MTTARILDLGNVRGFAGPQGEPGADGAKGADGSTILHGTGAPNNSLGNDGDFYLDTQSGKLYQKTSGEWGNALATIAMGSLDMSVLNIINSVAYNDLRHETDNDTREFFAPSVLEPDEALRAVKQGHVVSFTCIRKWNDAVTKEQYYYNFKNFGEGQDHHSFGPVLPAGWRPRTDVYFPCDAISANNTRYHGMFRLMPDGSFGAAKLYKSSNGAATNEVLLNALFFTVTFLAED